MCNTFVLWTWMWIWNSEKNVFNCGPLILILSLPQGLRYFCHSPLRFLLTFQAFFYLYRSNTRKEKQLYLVKPCYRLIIDKIYCLFHESCYPKIFFILKNNKILLYKETNLLSFSAMIWWHSTIYFFRNYEN